MNMKWHFLWERSLVIPGLKKLCFVFLCWLLWSFLTPTPIGLQSLHCGLVSSRKPRIYVQSDFLPRSYHPGYPDVKPGAGAACTWMAWCGLHGAGQWGTHLLPDRNYPNWMWGYPWWQDNEVKDFFRLSLLTYQMWHSWGRSYYSRYGLKSTAQGNPTGQHKQVETRQPLSESLKINTVSRAMPSSLHFLV